MHKKNVFLSLACLCFCFGVCDSAFAEAGRFSYLKNWVDKYPATVDAPTKKSMLESEPVRKALLQLLPKTEYSLLKKFSVESKVKLSADYVVARVCRPHNCPADTATLVFGTTDDQLWVGFFSRESARVSTRWYGSKEAYSKLPPEIINEFNAEPQ